MINVPWGFDFEDGERFWCEDVAVASAGTLLVPGSFSARVLASTDESYLTGSVSLM